MLPGRVAISVGALTALIYGFVAFWAWAIAGAARPDLVRDVPWKVVSFPLFWLLPSRIGDRFWGVVLLANGALWVLAVTLLAVWAMKVAQGKGHT